MSRYTDYFNTHNYKSKFDNLVPLVNELSLGDLSQTSTVNEILRLKKVVTYIDEILKSLDPELVPLNIWDPFAQYTNNTYSEVANFQGNRNIGHIQNANTYVDNLLNLVRPYMLVKGKAKSVSENVFANTQKSLEVYLDNFQSKAAAVLDQIKAYLVESETRSKTIQTIQDQVEGLQAKVAGDDTNDGLVDDIVTAHTEALETADKIEALQIKLLVGKGKDASIDTQITQAYEDVLANKSSIDTIKASVEEEIQELKEFYIKVFGKLNDEDERVGGLSSEISERLSFLRTLEASNRMRYDELLKQIESLLPGATSAGLARAYMQMKRSYDKPIIWFTRFFYVAIGLLVVFSTISIFDVSYDNTTGWHFGIYHYDTWDAAIKGLINKLPLYGSLIWFAYYVSKRRSEAQRLQQEYAHKEALAKSYASYRKQIDALDTEDKELQRNFIEKMVDAIAYNASGTLDGNHGDKHPLQEIFGKLGKKFDDLSPSEIIDSIRGK
jgi:rubrerythrin